MTFARTEGHGTLVGTGFHCHDVHACRQRVRSVSEEAPGAASEKEQ